MYAILSNKDIGRNSMLLCRALRFLLGKIKTRLLFEEGKHKDTASEHHWVEKAKKGHYIGHQGNVT